MPNELWDETAAPTFEEAIEAPEQRDELGSSRRRKRDSGKVDYNTQPEVLECIYKLGEIACDPFWNPECLVQAKLCWQEADDSLTRIIPEGLTYVNSPYGAFLRRLAPIIALWATLPNREIFQLVPASPGMEWYERGLTDSAVTLNFRGRLRFSGAKSGAFFDSSLFCYTGRPAEVVEAFKGIAYPVARWKP
jgi:hypothetical protein